jgi:hypothetical protein
MFDRLKHAKRQDEFEERLSLAERKLNALTIEWADTLDRLKRMMGRVVKERARTEAASPEEPESVTETEDGIPLNRLTPRQQAAQAAILSRRTRSQ